MAQDPPRRGKPPPVTEINADPDRTHTPIPSLEATTEPPPQAMPMRPPKGYEGPRPRLDSHRDERTLVGSPAPPPRPQQDSREVATETLLIELAERATAEREARAEAEELRLQLRALDAAHRLPRVEAAAESSRPPKRSDWAKLLFGLGGALTLFLGAAGTYLGARAAAQEGKVDHVAAVSSAQQVVVGPLPEKVQATERAAVDCRKWAREYSDYERQVFRASGIVIPEPPNSPPVTPIKTVARVRKANSVTSAPILEVLTPPPELP